MPLSPEVSWLRSSTHLWGSLLKRASNPEKRIELLTWVLPPLFTPAGRYFFSDSPDDRQRLFVRDLSTLSLGTVIYMGARLISERMMGMKPAASFGVAMVANQLFTVFGAVHLANWVTRKSGESQPFQPPPSDQYPFSFPSSASPTAKGNPVKLNDTKPVLLYSISPPFRATTPSYRVSGLPYSAFGRGQSSVAGSTHLAASFHIVHPSSPLF